MLIEAKKPLSLNSIDRIQQFKSSLLKVPKCQNSLYWAQRYGLDKVNFLPVKITAALLSFGNSLDILISRNPTVYSQLDHKKIADEWGVVWNPENTEDPVNRAILVQSAYGDWALMAERIQFYKDHHQDTLSRTLQIHGLSQAFHVDPYGTLGDVIDPESKILAEITDEQILDTVTREIANQQGLTVFDWMRTRVLSRSCLEDR